MRTLVPLVSLLVMAACTERDEVGVPISRTTPLCDGLVGIDAIGWEYYNGVPVTDPIFPPPVPVGAVYGHSAFPLLGFMHDPGWTAFEIDTYDTQGVDLVRNDNRAIWRYVFVTLNGVPTNEAVIDFEVGLASKFFGVLTWNQPCERQATGEIAPGSGIVTSVDNRLLRGPDRTLLISTAVTPFPGLPTSGVYIRLLSAPTEEWGPRLYDSFMAIDWQLLVGDPDRTTSDRDGDGWIDEFDRYPDDPTRH